MTTIIGHFPGGGPPGNHHQAPEVGFTGAGAAITLLAGLTMIFLDRRRRKTVSAEGSAEKSQDPLAEI